VTEFDNKDLQESPSASNNIIINSMDNKTLVDWVPHVDHQDQNDDNAEEDEQPRVMSLPTASGASLKDNERKNKTIIVLQYSRSTINPYNNILLFPNPANNIFSFQQDVVNNIVVSPSRQTIHCDVSDAVLLERTRQEMYTKTCRCSKEGQKAMTDDTVTEKRRIK
jgi:hypothetical protein